MKKNTRFMLSMVLSSLIRRRSRLLVALFGISIGATVLLGMVTLCYDIPRQMSKEFRSYGANMVFVSSGTGSMSMADATRAAELLPKDKLIGMTPYRYIPVRHTMQPYTAVGTDFSQAKKTSPYWQIRGATPSQPGQVLIGADIAEFTHRDIGAALTLDGRNEAQSRFNADVTVSGIIKSGGIEDGFIFMSLEDMERMTEEPGKVDVLEISLGAPEKELKELAALVTATVPSVEARPVKRVTQSETAVLGKLEMLVYLVTLVVMVLTMICVATTMMTVVMERRKEIGLKKALGAENRQVAGEFLMEGLMLGILGGLLGGIGGLLFAQLISATVFGRSIAVTVYLIPITVVVSVLVTIVACLLPARRAVDVEPALVLRGE